MAGALEGVRVLDFSQIYAGPFASQLLSEMGADVLKVEPLQGEPSRGIGELMPHESRQFVNHNRGKRGVSIDLQRPEAAPVREALLRWADVIVANYRPGVAERLKLDYATARAIRPDVIYCENTTFGTRGPHARRGGYDIIAQSVSGLLTSNAVVVDGVPQPITMMPADYMTGALMAWAISSALYHREKTGEGQRIDSSLLLTALYWQQGFKEIVAVDAEPRAARLARLQAARDRGAPLAEIYAERRAALPDTGLNIYYRVHQTKDGYLVVGCVSATTRAAFCTALQIEDPRYAPGFSGSPEELRQLSQALVQQVEALFLTRTTEEWLAQLDSCDVPCGPVQFVEELWDDPQVVANNYVAEYDHTLLGPLRAAAPAVSMSATPTRVQRAAPALGEHNDEVLTALGFSAAEIGALREGGVIG